MMLQTKNIIICSLVLLIVTFISRFSLCQSEAQISIPFEIYDNAGGQKILYFGLDQTATDGIDIHLGESDLPPYPPTGAFDARWLLPENGFNGSLSSWLDYRNAPGFPFTGTVEHRFRYQSAGGATAMFFSWNLPPAVTGLIQDLANGAIVNIQISGSGTYQLNNFALLNQMKLMVYYNNIVSGVENIDELPSDFILEQNYPNPFNPTTKIKYSIPASSLNPFSKGEGTFVTLKVYDILGNEVATLVNEEQAPGVYEIEFDVSSSFRLVSAGRSPDGLVRNLPSGIYFYQLRTSNFVQTKKMILLK